MASTTPRKADCSELSDPICRDSSATLASKSARQRLGKEYVHGVTTGIGQTSLRRFGMFRACSQRFLSTVAKSFKLWFYVPGETVVDDSTCVRKVLYNISGYIRICQT